MVIFTDLSEVLIRGFYGIEKLVAERFGKEVGDRFWQRHLEVNDDFQNLLRGRESEDEHWGKFFASGGNWPFGIKDVKAMFSENMRIRIDDGKVLKVYQRIIKFPEFVDGAKFIKGMPDIYLTSDHITERLGEIKDNYPGIFRVIKKQFWSCQLGMIKSDPGFFPLLLKITGLDPRDIILVDDSIDNIIAAAKCGISGICFQNANQLEKALESYGFELAPATP